MRLPQFIIIGPMKAGTTTLFRWLETVPGVVLPGIKEPHFFSEDAHFRRGIQHYANHFESLGPGITGEASVRYSDPSNSEKVARRIRAVVPDATLAFIARDPISRMRSHYRHEVQRGRERRPFLDAIDGAASPYLRASLYGPALSPFRERFPTQQLLVLDFDDLFGTSSAAWDDLLVALTLAPHPRPQGVHNKSAGKKPFTPLMKLMFDRGATRVAPRIPASVRTLVRPLFLRTDSRVAQLLSTSEQSVPAEVLSMLASA